NSCWTSTAPSEQGDDPAATSGASAIHPRSPTHRMVHQQSLRKDHRHTDGAPMSEQTAAKVTGAHLARTAYLYVRQSTLRQVLTNTESAARQYALRQKAIALVWEAEHIVTIDTDQGQSGASAADREGFQRLVAEVGMGRAGIVLGLEVSRLARNNADW